MTSANGIDYAVIALYAMLMVVVGIYVMRFNRGAAEYFRGGSRIPWLVAGLSCFMSGFSAWTFTGAAGVAYRAGFAATGLYIGNALSFLLGYFVFAKRWRRSRITTVMEYLSGRFNRTTHQTFSWSTIVFQLFTAASTLYGLSLFVSSACGFPVMWTILGAGAIIVFYCVLGGLWAVVVTDFLQASILMPFCLVLVITSLMRVGGVSGLIHSLPPQMKTIHVSGEFGWIYLFSWTVMVSFGYNTSAMAQRYFSVDDERSAKKVALLCCGLFFVGAFLWFIPPMAMRVLYPDLHSIWPALPNPSESAYAVASLTLLPHGLIGVMLAAMFSSTMANLSAQFNLKSAILSKDVYQQLFRKDASDRELLVVGWVTTFLVGGATTVLAAAMSSSGQSVFHIMLTFNTLMSLAYGPPALLGLVVRRSPPWSGLASFITGIVLGLLGAFVYHWTLIQQVAIIIPSSFGVFFLSMLLDRGDTPGRALLFKNLATPVDISVELKDSPDFTVPVFRFLSATIIVIGLLSLLLLVTAPPEQRMIVVWFAALTLAVGSSLHFIHGGKSA
ncbi:MAG TPA: sodium/solute symporter [Terriglobales bacterium]|jgi:SSS family transporter|nr:sodium/solute symporter [Terriglobales bacterium]